MQKSSRETSAKLVLSQTFMTTASRFAEVDPFVQQRGRIENDLEKLFKLLKTFDHNKHANGRTREVIEGQSGIRSAVEALARQLRALRGVLEEQKAAAAGRGGRRKNKQGGVSLSPQEVQERERSVEQLAQELQHVQDYQRSGFITSYQRLVFPSEPLSAQVLPASSTSLPQQQSSRPQQQQQGVTALQRQGLEEMRSTDAVIDMELGTLERGTADQLAIVRQQNEEVQRQDRMLQGLDGQFETSQSKAVTVNAALKGALAAKKKRRSCDVMVTNLLCSLLALALLAVLVVLLVTS